jgi:hypothetical protein
MKYIIPLLFIFFNSFSQNENNFTIEGILLNCKTNKSDNGERYLKLKKNNEIIKTDINSRFGEFKIKNLSKGIYTFELTNIFEQIFTKEIEIKDSITEVELCIEEFIDTKEKTLLENLKKNETLEILITSSGCFHFEKEKLKYYYKNDKLIIEFFKNEKRRKRKTLNKREISELILFERKIIQMKNKFGGCTSSNIYVFTINKNKLLEVIDASCDWDGYYELKKNFFGIK